MTHPNILADNAVAAAHLAVCAAVGKPSRSMSLYELHATAAERCEEAARLAVNQQSVKDEFAAMAREMADAAESFLAKAGR